MSFKGLVILLGRACLLGYVVFSGRERVLLAISDLVACPPQCNASAPLKVVQWVHRLGHRVRLEGVGGV